MPDTANLQPDIEILKNKGAVVAPDNVVNEILPFCAQGQVGRDLLSQADYAADMQRNIGHQPGIARAMLANKQARQVAHIAAGLAQFLARRYAPGVVDDGDLDKIEAALVASVKTIRPEESPFTLCAAEGATAIKAIEIEDFELVAGAKLYLYFSEVNTAANPKISINGGEAKPLLWQGMPPEVGNLAKGQVYQAIYTGENWQIMSGMAPWGICQTAWWEDTLSRPGFLPMNGGTVDGFSALYPQAAAYLNTAHGQARCFASLSARDAAHTATWATLADGGTVGWAGLGGISKFFWDKTADKLYLPDLVGMFRCMAGDGVVAPSMAQVGGDRIRNIAKSKLFYAPATHYDGHPGIGGMCESEIMIDRTTFASVAYNPNDVISVTINPSRAILMGATNIPRSWASLATCYLGQKS